jgi:hypothetical protein
VFWARDADNMNQSLEKSRTASPISWKFARAHVPRRLCTCDEIVAAVISAWNFQN